MQKEVRKFKRMKSQRRLRLIARHLLLLNVPRGSCILRDSPPPCISPHLLPKPIHPLPRLAAQVLNYQHLNAKLTLDYEARPAPPTPRTGRRRHASSVVRFEAGTLVLVYRPCPHG